MFSVTNSNNNPKSSFARPDFSMIKSSYFLISIMMVSGVYNSKGGFIKSSRVSLFLTKAENTIFVSILKCAIFQTCFSAFYIYKNH